MHIPFNFGHTIEHVALLQENNQREHWLSRSLVPDRRELFLPAFGELAVPFPHFFKKFALQALEMWEKPTAEHWGHANKELTQMSEVTGCPMYFTPQKYWPNDLARRYFGNKTVFGVLRDPYERLVALFRGNLKGYGGGFDAEDVASCDVNNAIKKLMKKGLEHTAKGQLFAQKCTFIPQAEYFDGPYGITLPVNNRAFPKSMNEVFRDHNYFENHIRHKDVFHVFGCPEVWAGDLDEETRAMVRKMYARDFDLLCEHFGYCDDEANTCIQGVDSMCPKRVLKHGLASIKPSAEDKRRQLLRQAGNTRIH
jgi:hypothetical protein